MRKSPNPIDVAIQQDDVQFIQGLPWADVLEWENRFKANALMWAYENHAMKCIDWLKQQEWPPEATDFRGRNVLCFAISAGHEDWKYTQQQQGWGEGETLEILQMCILGQDQEEIVLEAHRRHFPWVWEMESADFVLSVAVRKGWLKVLALFIDRKGWDRKSVHGNSLLHDALNANQTEVAIWLYERNPNALSFTNKKNQTPFATAIFTRNWDVSDRFASVVGSLTNVAMNKRGERICAWHLAWAQGEEGKAWSLKQESWPTDWMTKVPQINQIKDLDQLRLPKTCDWSNSCEVSFVHGDKIVIYPSSIAFAYATMECFLWWHEKEISYGRELEPLIRILGWTTVEKEAKRLWLIEKVLEQKSKDVWSLYCQAVLKNFGKAAWEDTIRRAPAPAMFFQKWVYTDARQWVWEWAKKNGTIMPMRTSPNNYEASEEALCVLKGMHPAKAKMVGQKVLYKLIDESTFRIFGVRSAKKLAIWTLLLTKQIALLEEWVQQRKAPFDWRSMMLAFSAIKSPTERQWKIIEKSSIYASEQKWEDVLAQLPVEFVVAIHGRGWFSQKEPSAQLEWFCTKGLQDQEEQKVIWGWWAKTCAQPYEMAEYLNLWAPFKWGLFNIDACGPEQWRWILSSEERIRAQGHPENWLYFMLSIRAKNRLSLAQRVYKKGFGFEEKNANNINTAFLIETRVQPMTEGWKRWLSQPEMQAQKRLALVGQEDRVAKVLWENAAKMVVASGYREKSALEWDLYERLLSTSNELVTVGSGIPEACFRCLAMFAERHRLVNGYWSEATKMQRKKWLLFLTGLLLRIGNEHIQVEPYSDMPLYVRDNSLSGPIRARVWWLIWLLPASMRKVLIRRIQSASIDWAGENSEGQSMWNVLWEWHLGSPLLRGLKPIESLHGKVPLVHWSGQVDKLKGLWKEQLELAILQEEHAQSGVARSKRKVL